MLLTNRIIPSKSFCKIIQTQSEPQPLTIAFVSNVVNAYDHRYGKGCVIPFLTITQTLRTAPNPIHKSCDCTKKLHQKYSWV